MTRTDRIRQLLTRGSYSVEMLRDHVKRPDGKRWSAAAIETSLRELPTKRDANLYTIEP